MKRSKEEASAVGPDRTRSGLTKGLAFVAAALFLCAAAVLLYGWVEAGRHKPVLRPIATPEALLGSLPRPQPAPEPVSGEGEAQDAAEEPTQAAEQEPAPAVAPKPVAPRAQAAVAPKPPPKDIASPDRDRALAVGLYRSQANRIEMERMLDGLALPYYHKKQWKNDQTHLLTVKAADAGKLDSAAEALAAAGYDFERTPAGLAAYFFDDEDAGAALAVIAKAGAKGNVAKKTAKAPRWAVYCGPLTEEEAEAASRRLAGKGIKVLSARYEP